METGGLWSMLHWERQRITQLKSSYGKYPELCLDMYSLIFIQTDISCTCSVDSLQHMWAHRVSWRQTALPIQGCEFGYKISNSSVSSEW